MRWLVAVLGLCGLLVVLGVLLPRIADDLPGRLPEVARLPERARTRLFGPPRGMRLAALTPPERAVVPVLRQRVDGLIAWSSSRSGNHELYLLDLRARSLRQLTHDPRVDSFSRISPDGRSVLFLRSQGEPGAILERLGPNPVSVSVGRPAPAGTELRAFEIVASRPGR